MILIIDYRTALRPKFLCLSVSAVMSPRVLLQLFYDLHKAELTLSSAAAERGCRGRDGTAVLAAAMERSALGLLFEQLIIRIFE
jgi:hypothetical protein